MAAEVQQWPKAFLLASWVIRPKLISFVQFRNQEQR
jgi:hypothetical protein